MGTLTFKYKNSIYGEGGYDNSAIPSRLLYVSSYTNKWHITGIVSYRIIITTTTIVT